MALDHGEDSSRPPIVAFLGPVASYTHQAALECFESGLYEYRPAVAISDIFEAVQSGDAALGVVPFENSTNGAVIFTLELLADRHSRYSDVNVCREAYLDVSHCLLGRRTPRQATDSPIMSGACTPTMSTPSPLTSRTTPLSSLQHVKRLYSHPQAWGQCDIFLASYLKGIERIDVSSTSKAAQIVKEDISGTSAAIASKLAAEVHGLDIMAQGIEDREDNTTRFLVLRKGVDREAGKTNTNKTLISFKVDHSTPGALASVLHCFQTYSLNLTSINSRPTKLIPFQYIFFVEFEGSVNNDPGDKVKNTLAALERFVQSWRWLGSWDSRRGS